MTEKKVSIIYTGGTLGMRPSAKGYAPAGDLDALLKERLPELGMASMPGYELSEYEHPLESSNATPHHWYALAERIEASEKDFDGFVVIHGTDTLAFTASALSFLLGGLGKPVILTGSQIPLCEVRNDASGNLIAAMQAIATGNTNEVCVCFGRYILRGNRTTKVHATELDAFRSPNFPPLVEIGTHFKFADIPPLPSDIGELAGAPTLCTDRCIAVLSVYPGMAASLIDAVRKTEAAGIVLRCYGVGTAPTADPDFLAALKRASKAGVIVVAVSQCLEGSVSLGRYAAGSALADAGVIGGFDMTLEAAFTKLHVILALGLDRARIAGLMRKSLRGELTAS
ncbi:MAG: type I asparaginase [Rhodomicrobium sp.]|nr:type I asparaginase [Rhodomicrobium sp.]